MGGYVSLMLYVHFPHTKRRIKKAEVKFSKEKK
jgi:hypothetical protein